MSYLALYRKYRPNSFSDVYGQEEVVKIIKNAVINNKMSHAYLFSGPRGTGKTTIAKIIARLVNCEHLNANGEPCGKCYNCLNFNNNDIVEIDAASNNGVDEIRELRDKINLVPSNSKYKVYIIDEVHMLTNQAFNALLKTLEEPPSHVIFILATTEPHKIPLTILSRCQKFKFSKIDDNKIVDRLKIIANDENIKVSDDALYEIARIADGGMRDAINILDQLFAYSNSSIDLDDVYKVNGSVSYDELFKLLNSIYLNDNVKIIETVDKLDIDGKDITKFIEELILFVKDVILYKNADYLSNIEVKNRNIMLTADIYDSNTLYCFIESLVDIQNSIKLSSHGWILFLTFVLKFSDDKFKNDLGTVKNTEENCEIISQEIKVNDNFVKNIDEGEKNSPVDIGFSIEETSRRINNAFALASKDVLNEFRGKWNLIDDYISDSDYSAVAGILKDSLLVVASKEYVIISSELDSVVNRINENYELCEKLLKTILNENINLVAISKDNWNIQKNEYISNIKNGVKYFVKDKNNDVVKNENNKSPVDDLINLLGDSMIEYK